MGAISGQFATVDIGSSEVVECTGWSFTPKANIVTYASCSTDGFKKTVAGTKEGDGSFSGMFDDTNMITSTIAEGDDVILKLYLTAVKFYLVPATIESLSFEVDIEEGAIVGWEASFIADGSWTIPA